MKTLVRVTALLGLSVVFAAVAIYSGRQWFIYAAMYAGTAGHPQLDAGQSGLMRLETEWYWATVVSVVLVLICWGLAVLKLVSKPEVE